MKIYDVRGIGASLTGSFSGSFKGLFTGPLDGVAATSSYVEYSNIVNKPALVSGSAQIEGFNIFATTGSNQFNGNQVITGSLTVTGQVIAQTLNVQQVTSSIVYSSGSNIFGNNSGNTHSFTGSVGVTGSLTVAGAVYAGGATSASILTGASELIVQNEIGIQSADSTGPYLRMVAGSVNQNFTLVTGTASGSEPNLLFNVGGSTRLTLNASTGAATFSNSVTAGGGNGPTLGFHLTTTAGASTPRITNDNVNATVIRTGASGSPVVINNFANSLELVRFTDSGNVLIGSTSGTTLNDLTNQLSVSSTSYNLFDISRFSNNAFGPNFYLVKSRNGTIGSNTIVESGDNLGNIIWTGANGTGFTDAAAIKAEVDGTPGASNDMPGRLVFSTTADGSGSPTERLRISSTGAATFTNSTSGNALRLYTSYASGRALNFGFSDGSVLPTAAFYVGNQTAVGVYIGDETTTNGLYVKANGNVGLGTTTPERQLVISNAGAEGIEFTALGSQIYEVITYNRSTATYTPLQFESSAYTFNRGAATFNSSVTVNSTVDLSGDLTIGGNTTNFAGGAAYTKSNIDSVLSSGTISITTNGGGGGYAGFLIVSSTYLPNAGYFTFKTFSVLGRGTTATFSEIQALNGPSSPMSFTTSVPSNGQLTITNTSGLTAQIRMLFTGHSTA